MEHIKLKAITREVTGKKVRFLRRQGVTPIHLFGHDIKSLALQCDTAELKQVLAKAGKTQIISLHLDNVKKARGVVVREIQREACTGELLHIDLYQVITTEKTKMEVPIVLVGEAPALKAKENMLEQALGSLAVECLPADTPARIEVDLSPLTEAGSAIRVKDIELGEKITVLNDPELLVAKISVRHAIREEVAVAEAPEEKAEKSEGE